LVNVLGELGVFLARWIWSDSFSDELAAALPQLELPVPEPNWNLLDPVLSLLGSFMLIKGSSWGLRRAILFFRVSEIWNERLV
jgi:hypothetical protein